MLAERGGERALVSKVVDAAEAELDVLVAAVEDRVMAQVQAADVKPPPELHEALRRGVAAGARDSLARLRSPTQPPAQLLPDLAELARLCAALRFEPAGLTDAWLAGEEVFWHRLQEVAERTLVDTGLCWDALKAARLLLWGHAARVSELFRKEYERESARVAGVIEDASLQAVLRVLDGRWVDPDDLGYDLDGHHVAVVADDARTLDAVARDANRHLLRVEAPDGAIWGWLGGRTRMSEKALDALIASRSSSNATIAFGEPAEGIAGFATSHHEALEARAVAVATDQRAVRFADCRLLIAVLRDGDLANGFIERELGDLGGGGKRMRELRKTLRAYLEHSQSVSATAALRRRDRKTIERQLRSAEQLIHHSVSERCDEVLIALRVTEILRDSD